MNTRTRKTLIWWIRCLLLNITGAVDCSNAVAKIILRMPNFMMARVAHEDLFMDFRW